MKSLYNTLLILSLFIFQPLIAQAAILSMEPSVGRYGISDSFPVDIKIDTEKECINVVQAEITFSKELEVIDFLIGDSILNLWVEKPSSADIQRINDINKISFSGGIPGGFCGQVPGDPGSSNIVGRIIFKVKGGEKSVEQKADISFQGNTVVLLNDGAGTAAKLSLNNAQFTLENKPVSASSTWQEQINGDKTEPEPFVIELRHDEGIFSGKYYINFATTDKQSGVDHFDVLEIRPDQEVGIAPKVQWWEKLLGKKAVTPEWTRGVMPYMLEDQTLQSIIKVKAVDKAGNERIEDYIPPKNMQQPDVAYSTKPSTVLYSIIGLFTLLALIIILIFIFKKFKAKRNEGGKKA